MEGEGTDESEEKKEDKRDLIETEGDTKDYEAQIDAVIINLVGSTDMKSKILEGFAGFRRLAV